jgi:hypothetical protein
MKTTLIFLSRRKIEVHQSAQELAESANRLADQYRALTLACSTEGIFRRLFAFSPNGHIQMRGHGCLYKLVTPVQMVFFGLLCQVKNAGLWLTRNSQT